jgi:hypothetical protein
MFKSVPDFLPDVQITTSHNKKINHSAPGTIRLQKQQKRKVIFFVAFISLSYKNYRQSPQDAVDKKKFSLFEKYLLLIVIYL